MFGAQPTSMSAPTIARSPTSSQQRISQVLYLASLVGMLGGA